MPACRYFSSAGLPKRRFRRSSNKPSPRRERNSDRWRPAARGQSRGTGPGRPTSRSSNFSGAGRARSALSLFNATGLGASTRERVALQLAAFEDHRQALVQAGGNVVLLPRVDAVSQVGVKRLVIKPDESLTGAFLEEEVDLLVRLAQFVAFILQLFLEFLAFLGQCPRDIAGAKAALMQAGGDRGESLGELAFQIAQVFAKFGIIRRKSDW